MNLAVTCEMDYYIFKQEIINLSRAENVQNRYLDCNQSDKRKLDNIIDP